MSHSRLKAFAKKFALLAVISLASTLLTAPVSQAANNLRSTVDRPDDFEGHQIHLIYIQPKDAEDKAFDTSGQLSKWVDASQAWLLEKTGKKFIYDTFNGIYDITYLKSEYTKTELFDKDEKKLESEKTSVTDKLIEGYVAANPAKANAKTYFFFSSEPLRANSCGWASRFSSYAVGFAGNGCWGGPQDDSTTTYGVSWPTQAITHELVHSFGVSHVCYNTTDLMIGDPECPNKRTFSPITLDIGRNSYFGSDKAGIDIDKLPIWNDKSGSREYSKIYPTKTYGTTMAGNYVAEIGKTPLSISWSWNMNLAITKLSPVSCRLDYGSIVLSKLSDTSTCTFDIPANWRAGRIAKVTAEIKVGPFWGTASEEVKLMNSAYSFTPCTEEYCFVGEEWSSPAVCWGAQIDEMELQELVGTKWVTFGKGKTTSNSGRCSSKTVSESPLFKKEFTAPGVHIFRWVSLANKTYAANIQDYFVLTVMNSEEGEPSKDLLKANKEKGDQLVAEYEAAKLAEAEAARKLEAERKAAAEAAKLAEAEAARKLEAERIAAAEAAKLAEAEAARKLEAERVAAEAVKLAEAEAARKLEAEKKAAAEAAKQTLAKKRTITCQKGKLVKKVTAVTPKCPLGYKKK